MLLIYFYFLIYTMGSSIRNISLVYFWNYVFMALFADVLDHLEWKNNFRCDGIAMSIYNIIAVTSVGIVTGLFNMLLSKSGYVAPSLINGETVAAVQSAATKNAITFSFVGLESITAVILIVILAFINVEKYIDKEQEEIKARKEKEEQNESN